MQDALYERGLFRWLTPEQPREELSSSLVSGLLQISDEGHIQLNLDQPLPHPSMRLDFQEVAPENHYITGRLFSGQHVRLELLKVSSFSLSGSLGPTGLRAGYCLASDESIIDLPERNTTLRFELTGLDNWTNMDCLSHEEEYQSVDDRVHTVKESRQTWTSTAHDVNVTADTLILSPMGWLLGQRPRSMIEIKQTNWITIEFHNGFDIGGAADLATRFEEFIALLLGSYFRLDWATIVTGSPPDQWCKLYWFRGQYTAYTPDFYNTFVPFEAVRSDLAQLFSKWLQQRSSYGPGYYLFIGGLRRSDYFIEHRFANLMWSLESLHRKKATKASFTEKSRTEEVLSRFDRVTDKKLRKWLEGRLKHAEEPTLETRIFGTFKSLPINFNEHALRKFASTCARRRNQVSHEGGPPDGEDYAEFRRDLERHAAVFRFLYAATLLGEMGMDQQIILDAVHKTTLAHVEILPLLNEFSLLAPA